MFTLNCESNRTFLCYTYTLIISEKNTNVTGRKTEQISFKIPIIIKTKGVLYNINSCFFGKSHELQSLF